MARKVSKHVRRELAEKVREARKIRPSARQLFTQLNQRRLDSRPITPVKRTLVADGQTIRYTEPVYGEPTFRNIINEKGEHV